MRSINNFESGHENIAQTIIWGGDAKPILYNIWERIPYTIQGFKIKSIAHNQVLSLPSCSYLIMWGNGQLINVLYIRHCFCVSRNKYQTLVFCPDSFLHIRKQTREKTKNNTFCIKTWISVYSRKNSIKILILFAKYYLEIFLFTNKKNRNISSKYFRHYIQWSMWNARAT